MPASPASGTALEQLPFQPRARWPWGHSPCSKGTAPGPGCGTSWGHTGDSELKTFEELNSKRCKSWELKLRVKFRFFQAGMEGFSCNPSRAPGLGIVLGDAGTAGMAGK